MTKWEGDWMQAMPFCRLSQGFKPDKEIPERTCITCLSIIKQLIKARPDIGDT